MQFKLPGPQVRSRPKRSTSQFKSPGLIIRSDFSASVAQNKSSTQTALPAQPQTTAEPPTTPLHAMIGHPTIPLPVKVPTQTPQQSAQTVTRPLGVTFRVFAVCLASIAVCANISNYGPLIPVLRSALHVGDSQIGLFSTFLFLGIIIANVPAGIFADRFGSRPVMLVALTLTTVGSLLLPIFPSFTWMLACRMLIGLGAGAALVTCSYACAQLGRQEPLGQGLKGAATQLGSGLGLVSMSFLQGLLGWRNSLFLCGILGIVALSLWLWYPKEVRSTDKGGRGHTANNPALAIRTPALWLLGLANMGSFGLANAITAWISVYFINLYGLPLVFAGSLGSAALFGGIFFQVLGGLLLARLRRPVLLIRIGTVMCFLAVFLLALPFHLLYLSIVGLILFSVGTTLPFAAIFSTASMVGKISGAGIGISQALVAMLALPAAITGAPLIGLILEHTGSFTTALSSIGLIFLTVAITASLFLGFVLKPILRKSFALSVQ